MDTNRINEVRFLICGGREFNDRVLFFSYMDEILEEIRSFGSDVVIIHGAARGADSLADSFASERGLRVERYPADWKTHGRAAGPIRNNLMLTNGKPDIIIAFSGGHGTADMIQQGERSGVPVYQVNVSKATSTRQIP